MTQPIAKVTHPAKPDTWVEIRKPIGIDRYERDRQAASLVRPIAITRPNGEIVMNKAANAPYFYIHLDQPSARAMCATLFPHIVSWQIFDAVGKPVPLSEANVAELFEGHLDVVVPTWFGKNKNTGNMTEDHEIRDSGEPYVFSEEVTDESTGVTKTVTRPVTPFLMDINHKFISFVTRALWKDETYDSDPTQRSSDSP